MRMQHVCLMELGYDTRFTFVNPGASHEGSGYGEGEGSCQGPRLNGTVRWVSHARRRGDGLMEPEGEGIVFTNDGAEVLFRFQGRAVTTKRADGSERGGQLLHITFETGAEPYAWMNGAMCIAEGVVDPGSLRLVLGVHQCLNEMIEKMP
ncbi:MAG: DUF3237 family protein [Dehalococcoidia bacterium]